MAEVYQKLPSAFIWRRLHSFTGLWFVIYLVEHLLTNSQAALFFGDDGYGFVHAVNFIHDLPYLKFIEIFLLGVPFLIHMVWGVKYLFTAKLNSQKTDGSSPSLGEYSRNRAYSWQRITSWILLIGIIAHVIHMRFVEYPAVAGSGANAAYMVRLNMDKGIYTVADRLHVQLFDQAAIRNEERILAEEQQNLVSRQKAGVGSENVSEYSPQVQEELIQTQDVLSKEEWVNALKKRPLHEGEVIAVSNSFGTATLLLLRDTFKSPLAIALYSLLVLAASYHAFNGLWTFMISWGVNLTARSQALMLKLSTGFMVLFAFFGLAAIWGTYWLNLKQ